MGKSKSDFLVGVVDEGECSGSEAYSNGLSLSGPYQVYSHHLVELRTQQHDNRAHSCSLLVVRAVTLDPGKTDMSTSEDRPSGVDISINGVRRIGKRYHHLAVSPTNYTDVNI